MAFELTLVVRKTHRKPGERHPKSYLQATVRFGGMHYQDPNGWINKTKGLGNDANIPRTEQAFVKFLLFNYGPGRFTILVHKGRYKMFWKGYIEWDRFARDGGNIAPYLKPENPRSWHNIQMTMQEKIRLMDKRPFLEEQMRRQIEGD